MSARLDVSSLGMGSISAAASSQPPVTKSAPLVSPMSMYSHSLSPTRRASASPSRAKRSDSVQLSTAACRDARLL